MVPEKHLHLYCKKGPIGHDQLAEERVEDFGSRVNDAVKEFVRLFEEETGNEFEPWEREKKFVKKSMKMYPLDMVLSSFFFISSFLEEPWTLL
jgi:poly [ADP-ribose] polymerase